MNILTRTQIHKTLTQIGPFFVLTTLMNSTIPHCNAKAKTNLPWISRELIRMQRRRNKSHKKAKQTGLNKHWEQFRELRRQTTKALATYGIIKQLKNLNQNKATGPDELPARVLKETAEQIAPIITHIFQQSYNTSKLPNDWLQALVTPIHKKSLKSDPANYRPISLTCILCKVMEHIIVSNIWKHLHKHDIILHFQHGFHSGLSCESQLIETVHDWMMALDNKTN